MNQKSCFHCGDKVIGKEIVYDTKSFCCSGCKSVYQLFIASDLSAFYSIDSQAGKRPKKINEHKYAFLEVDQIREKFIQFEDSTCYHITLFLPQIHCSSCIYLLENIQKIEPRVLSCQVNFTKREVTLILSKKITLVDLALLLDKIGYPPNFSDQKKNTKKQNNQYFYKLGIAGFAFGSIMLWSFPEYLGIKNDNPEFRDFTAYLSLIVSLPVILYSAQEYFISAFKSIKFKTLNLDVPITIGILALYIQSCYHIFTGLGPGYMDSFAGFVLFLLIGKWFQNRTYRSLSFDRDYTSYFPVAVTVVKNNSESIVEIDNVEINDRLLIRNQEIIPCDSIVISNKITIDYSFVTGESSIIKKNKGDLIYAGGKLIGKQSEFKVTKKSNRSHLTQLWNNALQTENRNVRKSDKTSIYFLSGLLFVALCSAIIWYFIDPHKITEIVVAILIVACPCALALSRPFTLGSTMRVLGQKGLYLKNSEVIDQINKVTDIVFDKTGTLTHSSISTIEYKGSPIETSDLQKLFALVNSSTHPLSRALVEYLQLKIELPHKEPDSFHEVSGEGIEGIVDGIKIKIGSASFVGNEVSLEDRETASHIAIDQTIVGRFTFKSTFRAGIDRLIKNLHSEYQIHILSGDTNKDRSFFDSNLPNLHHIHFNQSPEDKFNYIQQLHSIGKCTMMIGDGLNDSGALKSADVGIAISEDVFRFSPSSDAIIEASQLINLRQFLKVSKFSKNVLITCYIFSIAYNSIGLVFAISGNLTPIIAAILMPLSSISIVLISTLLSLSKSSPRGLKNTNEVNE